MMRIVDRYILRLFFKVVVVSFVSLTGLMIVIDTVGNLEEFVEYSRVQGSLVGVLADYYSARVFSFFDATSSLLALVGGMFTLTWLQRTNELTALMAAGVPRWRVIRPLVAAAACLSLAAAANRELGVPAVRDKLTRNAQDWLGDRPRPVQPCYDSSRGFLITGKNSYAADQRITEPTFRWTSPLPGVGGRVAAEAACYRPPAAGRPGGYLLRGVREPADVSRRPSVFDHGRPVLLTPADTPWLREDECFIPSDVEFVQLSNSEGWRRFSSTWQLISGLRSGGVDYGAEVRVTIHARIIQPLLDMALFLIGLPLVLTRENRNVFVAAGLGLAVVAGFFLVVMAFHAMGRHGYLVTPALAAWAPLILFTPLAVAAWERLHQ